MRRAALLLVLAGCASPRETLSPTQPPRLEVRGTSNLQVVDPDGTEHFSLSLSARNASALPLHVRRAEMMFLARGGWAWSLGDRMGRDGTLYGQRTSLAGGALFRAEGMDYAWSAPAAQVLVRLETDGALVGLAAIPIDRKGYATTADASFVDDIFIGLQEPVEVFPLSTGKKRLTVIGQIVNTARTPLTIRTMTMRLGAIDRRIDVEGEPSKARIFPFLQSLDVADAFDGGTLSIEATCEVNGQPRKLSRAVKVTAVTPVSLLPPVRGEFLWGNGPGETVMHPHYAFPEQRYAYDILVRGAVPAEPRKNEGYAAWDRPIYAAADGTVAEVIDDVPDNFGYATNPANSPMRNSHVVLRHPGDRSSVYAHVQQGSAAVKVGQTVKAGQLLARIGNAGFSTEPHLHFAYFGLDESGRARALPMTFDRLKNKDNAKVSGVPKGDVDYLSN